MFVAIPGLIYIFGLSLRDADGFITALSLLGSVCVKLIYTALAWAFGHHLFAGIRFLLIDLDIGDSLATAKSTAWAVNIAGVLFFILIAYKIWL